MFVCILRCFGNMSRLFLSICVLSLSPLLISPSTPLSWSLLIFLSLSLSFVYLYHQLINCDMSVCLSLFLFLFNPPPPISLSLSRHDSLSRLDYITLYLCFLYQSLFRAIYIFSPCEHVLFTSVAQVLYPFLSLSPLHLPLLAPTLPFCSLSLYLNMSSFIVSSPL